MTAVVWFPHRNIEIATATINVRSVVQSSISPKVADAQEQEEAVEAQARGRAVVESKRIGRNFYMATTIRITITAMPAVAIVTLV